MSWTDERIETLTKMWESGATASQIADELGGGQPQCRDRQGAPARPQGAPFAGQAQRGEAEGAHRQEGKGRAGRCASRRPGSGQGHQAAPSPRRPKPAPPRSNLKPQTRPRRPPNSLLPRPSPRQIAAHRLGRPRRLPASGSRRPAGADPARAAAPAGPRQAQPRDRRQDQPARSQRTHLPLADGPSRRAGLPLLRRQGEPRLSLLRRALRPGLSGAAAARCAPSAPAAAVRRPARSLKPGRLLSGSVAGCAGLRHFAGAAGTRPARRPGSIRRWSTMVIVKPVADGILAPPSAA